MKALNLVKKFLNITFAVFACLVFFLIFWNNLSSSYGGIMWAWSDIALLFGETMIFSAVAGFAVTAVDAFGKVPSPIRYIIKLVIIYIGLYFWRFDGVKLNGGTDILGGSTKLIMSTLYVVVFALIALIGAVGSYGLKRLAKKDGEYENVYSESDGEEKQEKKEKKENNKK